MRMPKPILLLLAAVFIGSLMSCHGGVRIEKKGDAEAVNGGDPFDTIMGNTRTRLLLALRRVQNGDALPVLNNAPTDCSGSVAIELCNASKNATTEQREFIVNYLRRNAGQATTAVNDTKLIPTSDPIVLPDGRTVLAAVGTDANGKSTITLNRSVLDLGEASRLALLTHEFCHIINDVVIGHPVTDDETVAGFSSPTGSGRLFADTTGAMLTIYAYSGTPAPETPEAPDSPGNIGASPTPTPTPRPYALQPLYKILDHGGSYVEGAAQWGDMNGDGKDDLLFVGTTNVLGPSLSTGDGLGPSKNAGTVPGGVFTPGQIQYADVNGDGKVDCLYQVTNSSDGTNTTWQGTSNGATFGTFVATMRHGGTFVAGEAQYADMTGDGKADLIYQGMDNRVWISPSVNGVIHTGGGLVADLGGGNWRGGGNVWYADANGDGKADLLYQDENNEFRVRFSDGNTFASNTVIFDHGGTYVPEDALFGDMSLDHRADLIFRGGDTLWLSLSAPLANSWYHPQNVITLPSGLTGPGDLLFGDMNGDGAQDIVFRGSDNKVRIAISKGTGFYPLTTYLAISAAYAKGQISLADLNGDGKKDLIFHDNQNDFWVALSVGLFP